MDELVVGCRTPKRGFVPIFAQTVEMGRPFDRQLGDYFPSAPTHHHPKSSTGCFLQCPILAGKGSDYSSEVVWVGLFACLFVCFFFVCAIQSSNRFNDCLNQWFQNVNGIHVVFLQPFYALFMIWFANYQHWHGQGWLLATCQMFWVDADGQTPALTPTKMNSSHLPRNRNPKGNSSEPTIDF